MHRTLSVESESFYVLNIPDLGDIARGRGGWGGGGQSPYCAFSISARSNISVHIDRVVLAGVASSKYSGDWRILESYANPRLRLGFATHVQYCRIDSIRQNNIIFVVDRKIAFHQEKWTKCCRFDRFVRFVKWKCLLSIGQVRSSIGQLHLISDNGDPVQDCRID